MQKKCPQCGRQYYEQHNFCSKCAVKLVKNHNRCSEPKSTLCEHSSFEDDDIVCSYCGSYTTYEAEQRKRREQIN